MFSYVYFFNKNHQMNLNIKSNQIFTLLVITLIMSCNSKSKFYERCEQVPKYYEKFKLPENIIGYNNYEQAVDCSKKINKPLAIYFTANTCKHCQAFEHEFLSTDKVSKLMNEHFVFVELFVDDKTALPKEDQFIERSHLTGKNRKIKNIGQLNCTLLPKFNHSSQPALFITNNRDSILTLINYNPDTKTLINKLQSKIENKK